MQEDSYFMNKQKKINFLIFKIKIILLIFIINGNFFFFQKNYNNETKIFEFSKNINIFKALEILTNYIISISFINLIFYYKKK